MVEAGLPAAGRGRAPASAGRCPGSGRSGAAAPSRTRTRSGSGSPTRSATANPAERPVAAASGPRASGRVSSRVPRVPRPGEARPASRRREADEVGPGVEVEVDATAADRQPRASIGHDSQASFGPGRGPVDAFRQAVTRPAGPTATRSGRPSLSRSVDEQAGDRAVGPRPSSGDGVEAPEPVVEEGRRRPRRRPRGRGRCRGRRRGRGRRRRCAAGAARVEGLAAGEVGRRRSRARRSPAGRAVRPPGGPSCPRARPVDRRGLAVVPVGGVRQARRRPIRRRAAVGVDGRRVVED